MRPASTLLLFNPSSWNFVKRVGNQLFDGPSAIRMSGMNMYWLGLDYDAGGFAAPPTGRNIIPSHARIDDAFATAVMMGANIVRSLSLGINYGSAGTLYPTLGGSYTEAVFQGIDYVIARARHYGIRLIIPFTTQNFGNWYLGTLGSFSNWGGTNFYSDSVAVNNFKAYISTLLNRVNTFNGIAYKNDPTILAWENGNELIGSPDAWSADICAYIKGIAPNQLVIDGSFGVRTASLTDANVDIVSDHFYPMDTTRLAADLATANLSNKVFIIGEYDNNQIYAGGSTLANFLAAVEAASAVKIDMFTDLMAPADTHGYQASYQFHTLDPTNVGTDSAWGDPTVYGGISVQTRLAAIRTHIHTVRSRSVPSYPGCNTPILNANMTWHGVVGAVNYQMERSTTSAVAGFSVISSTLTDMTSQPWVDPSPPGGSVWYRLSAINADGVVSAPSAAVQPAYPWAAGGATGCVAAWIIKGSPSLAASYVNLVSPGTHNAATVTDPAFDYELGWHCTGLAQLSTDLAPPAGTGSAFVRVDSVDASGGEVIPFGDYQSGAGKGAFLVGFTATGVEVYNGENNPNGTRTNTPAMVAGVYGFAGKAIYRNGVAESTTIPGGNFSNAVIDLCCLNAVATHPNKFKGNIMALFVYDNTLSPSAAAAVSAAMAAL